MLADIGKSLMEAYIKRKKDENDLNLSFYSGEVPKLGFNAAMIAIWGVILLLHCGFVYWKQYWFSVAFICTGILEVLGYIGRTWSHFNVYAENGYLLQIICLTIAPVFTMGGLYYQLAKLIEIYGHRFSLLPSPMVYSYFFIFCDIVSLAVQAAGGGVSGVAVNQGLSLRQGEHVFIGGLALQVATLSIFLMFWAHFCYLIYVQTRLNYLNIKNPFTTKIFKVTNQEIDHLYRDKYRHIRMDPERWYFKYFTVAFTVSVLCVFTRCCYRLAELVNGFTGYIVTHEWYFIPLEGIMMSLAGTLMTIFHPGFAFKGRDVSIKITHGRTDPETIQQGEGFDPSSNSSFDEKQLNENEFYNQQDQEDQQQDQTAMNPDQEAQMDYNQDPNYDYESAPVVPEQTEIDYEPPAESSVRKSGSILKRVWPF